MIPSRNCFVPVAIAAIGARLRAARFDADPCAIARGAKGGVCVLLNGQTEFIEKYFEVIDELRGRGFAVATMDWRGQGGSERQVPDAPLKAHIHDFAEYDADLAALMDQMVEPMLQNGERPIALAHSMGGHILLRYLQQDANGFAAAAFSAPMVMFSTGPLPRWLVRLVTCWMMRRGRATDFIWGMAGRDPLTIKFEQQIVTSDSARFRRSQDILKQHPQLRLGGVTWGWLAAASQSVTRMATPGFAERIATASLICGAGHDRVCISHEARRFTQRMAHGLYVEIAGAEHEILMERDHFRRQFWNAFDAVMAKR